MQPAGATPPPRDRGLQAERTALAWSRTAFTVLANALVALRAGLSGEQTAITVLGFALLGAAAVVFGHGVRRKQELLSSLPAVAPRAGMIGATAGIALAACAVGLAAVILTRAA